MNKITSIVLLTITAVALSAAVQAQLYKSVDEHGNIVYSDTPTPGAEQLTPPPISTVEGPAKAKAKKDEEKKAAEAEAEAEGKEAPKPPTVYTKFRMLEPKNEVTIWDNNGVIPVSLQIEPPLDTENGHSIWVYVDGNAVVRRSGSLTPPVSGIDRGAHRVRAEVRDSNRKTLRRTKTVTVHMKRASAIPKKGP